MKFVSIRGKRLNTNNLPQVMVREMLPVSRILEKDLNRTTKTWKGDKPEFETVVASDEQEVTLVIRITGKGVAKWNYLDKGTEVRFALMTDDFDPKTEVGVLDSKAGSGGLLIIVNHPLPGIKARKWRATLAKNRRKYVQKKAQTALNKFASRSGHSLYR